jgi:hypothetical protein
MRYPDLEVRRMHFPSHAYAVAYAMNTLDLDATRGPVFTELRGKQIVVLRGAAVADTAGLPALVDAAFGVGLPQSLPVPAERGTTSALLLKDGTLAVTSEDANEAFAQSFQRAHDKANEKIGQGAPGFRDDGGKLNFSFPSGVNGYVLDASGTKTVVIAQDATQRATLDEFLAVTRTLRAWRPRAPSRARPGSSTACSTERLSEPFETDARAGGVRAAEGGLHVGARFTGSEAEAPHREGRVPQRARVDRVARSRVQHLCGVLTCERHLGGVLTWERRLGGVLT